MSIKDLVEDFASNLHKLVEGHVMERARASVMEALGVPKKRDPGRPRKALSATTPITLGAKKTRKKAPIQLCPVPYCRNPAAPVFGMVCAKHKDVRKSLLKKYREARRAKNSRK
jgi:hypothetical protein